MKLTIKTSVLQEMTSRAVKGASQDKLIALTSMLAIELNEGKLVLHTTDMTNHLYIMNDNVVGDDFYVTVYVEQFSKLIGKLTCENVTLELKDNSLEVTGNGTYNLELPLDENGNLVKFPNPYKTGSYTGNKTIELDTIKSILNTAKASLATKNDIPCYTGYYMGDKVLATDTYKICGMSVPMFDEPVLISANMLDLFDIMTSEKIEVAFDNNVIIFITPDCVIYGYTMDGIDDFDVNAICKLIDTNFDAVCKVSKAELMSTIDRIALFVGKYDNKAIRLNFTADGLSISSKKTDGVETVNYLECTNFKPFTGLIDIEMLSTQLKAYVPDVVELHYGNQNFISLVNGNTTQIIALLIDNAE